MKNSPSLALVAELAGTSVATVSRVINGHPHISEQIRERVEQAIEKTNYRPSAMGRALRSGKCRTLGILRSPDAAQDKLYAEVITSHLVRSVTAEGYGVAAEFISTSEDGNLNIPDVVQSKRVDGVFIVGHLDDRMLDQSKDWGIPVCLLNNRSSSPGFYSCCLDDYAGSREATQHLVALGRSRIAFVHGSLAWPSTAGRRQGFLDAMAELGRDVRPTELIKVDDGDQNYRGGYLATEFLLKQSPDLDAIFYVNDWFAIGGISAARAAGKAIPEDLSIVGYDDSWMAPQTLPTLTSVSLEPEEICRGAAMVLVRAVERRPEVITDILVRPKLVIRESSTYRKPQSAEMFDRETSPSLAHKSEQRPAKGKSARILQKT
ncbi:LacI family DNA-binding transcriptional regulator [soil metagenome]